jgi:uncharacterized membrane protein
MPTCISPRSTPGRSSVVRKLDIGNRLALICAALTCAFALLAALATVDAHAAVVQDAHAGKAATSHHSEPRKHVPRSSRALWNNTTVAFRNSYGKTVWVAISRTDELCGWKKTGWYELAPGEVKRPFSTTSRYAYFYAMADDGAEWAGDYGPVSVYKERAFDECDYLVAWSHPNAVGMLEIDTQGTLYKEINLIP